MKSTVGYIWPFEDRCQLIYYQQPFWLLCICICLPVFLIQSNFDTGQAIHLVQIEMIQSRCTTNISRHLFFMFMRNNYVVVTFFISVDFYFSIVFGYGNVC